MGPPLGLATFFVKRALPHIKNLPKRKFGACILENLGPKTCFLPFWSIAGFKMMFLVFQMANFIFHVARRGFPKERIYN